MAKNLCVSLEEFGLSKYEAQAYLAMVERDCISAGELAYYAKIPRSKVYPTLLKLERKGLASVSKGRPITCRAVSPDGAFDGIIQDQINKINAMNALLSDLKAVSESSKKHLGSSEGRYFHLSANSVLARLGEMIRNSRSSIRIMVDCSGLYLLSECRGDILERLRKGVDVKMIVPPDAVGSDSLRLMPHDTDVRISETVQNCIVFDDMDLLMVDSGTGRGAVFATDVLATNSLQIFSHLWDAAVGAGNLPDLANAAARDALQMASLIRGQALHCVLSSTAATKACSYGLVDLVEDGGVMLKSESLERVVDIIDSALRMTCRGRVDFDDKSAMIVLESGTGDSLLPWIAVLEEYLSGSGYGIRTVRQGGKRAHIKICAQPKMTSARAS